MIASEQIGGNNPPDMVVLSSEVMTALSDWMAENPVISDEDKAREAKVMIDRGKICLQSIESERDGKVRPLNTQVKTINDYYRPAKEQLERVLSEVGRRVTTFLRLEEQKRIAAAAEAARIAAIAEQAAREAERREQEALEAADSGVLDIDTKAVVVAADDAFRTYEKATHQAALAEKDTKVRLGGGFLRSTSLKDKEIGLIVTQPLTAINAIGITEDIKEAIRKGARAYRKLHGELPPGVEAEIERVI